VNEVAQAWRAAPPLLGIVQQHVDETAALRRQRTRLVAGAEITLPLLQRHDERIDAHLDGIAVAAEAGRELVHAALREPGCGEVFAAAATAILAHDHAALDPLLALASANTDAARGLVSALGWVPAQALRGLAARLLASDDAAARMAGLAACAMHLADPGCALDAALADTRPALVCCALEVAGRLGRLALLPACLHTLDDAEPSTRQASVRAALLLGDRSRALAAASDDGSLGLLMRVMPPASALAQLEPLAHEPAKARTLVRCAGLLGLPQHIPWLLGLCGDPLLARAAGESFALITGLDLAQEPGAALPATDRATGPDGDPENDDVAIAEDEGLPWPDPDRLSHWWTVHGHRFPAGGRFFMGAPPEAAHCRRVLRHGSQRQRRAAAEWLCLLHPGTRLFPTSAPARHQQRWLDRMGA